MSEASQDRVTADGHLQTQSVSLIVDKESHQSIYAIIKKQNVENAATELGTMIDQLLDDLSTKFSAVSTEIFAKSKAIHSS